MAQFFSGPVFQSPLFWLCALGLGVALLWDQAPGFLGLNVPQRTAAVANPLAGVLADLRRRRRLNRLIAIETELAQLGVPEKDRAEALRVLLPRAIGDEPAEA